MKACNSWQLASHASELLDLAHVLELFQFVLQPLRNGKAGEQGHADFIEKEPCSG